MQVYNCTQQEKEWFEIRKSCMTGSHAQAIGNAGKGLETYIYEMMAETYSTSEKERFESEDTDRGNELEPLARSMYELENGVEVSQVGFIKSDEFTGVSPDGLVGDDGLIEIKCPNDAKYFKMLINGEKEIDSKYIWQCQMQMLVTERKWNDLVFYNPNFKKSMIIFRLYPDAEKFNELRIGLEKGKQLINELVLKYESNIR